MTQQNGMELISQADAARLRGVSRQRIEQLIGAGRLTPVPTMTRYGTQKMYLNKEEVLRLEEGMRGRPRLFELEKKTTKFEPKIVGKSKKPRHTYKTGQEVVYTYAKDSSIDAVVVKSAAKKIRIQFFDTANRLIQAWVKPQDLQKKNDHKRATLTAQPAN